MQGKVKAKPSSSHGAGIRGQAVGPSTLLVKKISSDPEPLVFSTPLQQREEEIQQLKLTVQRLEQHLSELANKQGSADATYAALEGKIKTLQNHNSMLDLENAQLKMKLESAETKLGKELTKVGLLGEQTHQNLGKVEALSRENEYLRERLLEKESRCDRLETDLKVCSMRLDKANLQLVEMQELLNKKQQDVGTLEKVVARKNEHLEILLRKDKEISSVLKKKREEVLEERLLAQVEESEGQESYKEREWREQASSSQAQVEVWKKKHKRAEEEKASLEREAKKLREDNFYLTNRLKTLKKPN